MGQFKSLTNNIKLLYGIGITTNGLKLRTIKAQQHHQRSFKIRTNEIRKNQFYRSHVWARLLFDLFLIDGDSMYSFIVLSHEYSLVRFIIADLFNVLIFSSPSLDANDDIVDDG